MTALVSLRRTWSELLTAIQFLTRIPVPSQPYEADSLARAVKYFPVVGFLLGSLAALLYFLLALHLPQPVVALLVVIFLVFVTGGLHEDGLADVADGFGGGRDREQILRIMRDSRIGTYGAAALALSLLARVLLLSSLPLAHLTQYLISSHVLCRWTTLPLSYYLRPARSGGDTTDGQGARVAQLTSRGALIAGSIFSLVVVGLLLRIQAVVPILMTIMVTLLSALYYQRRIDGITGDCFGATNQLTEIAVYLCGVWIA
jgi:adenosylcobinamide-GDP ribazoletransferase